MGCFCFCSTLHTHTGQAQSWSKKNATKKNISRDKQDASNSESKLLKENRFVLKYGYLKRDETDLLNQRNRQFDLKLNFFVENDIKLPKHMVTWAKYSRTDDKTPITIVSNLKKLKHYNPFNINISANSYAYQWQFHFDHMFEPPDYIPLPRIELIQER